MTDIARDEYTKGLRQLADLLDANPDLSLPTQGADDWSPIDFYFTYGEDDKKALANFARIVPGTLNKDIGETFYKITGNLVGLHIRALAYRNEVCERRVVGKTTKVIPATPAIDAEPERIEFVDDVEWVCGSLLADTKVSS